MLTIWYDNGATSHFDEVSDFEVNNGIITCTYFGQHFQVRRKLVVRLTLVAAYAYNPTT